MFEHDDIPEKPVERAMMPGSNDSEDRTEGDGRAAGSGQHELTISEPHRR